MSAATTPVTPGPDPGAHGDESAVLDRLGCRVKPGNDGLMIESKQ